MNTSGGFRMFIALTLALQYGTASLAFAQSVAFGIKAGVQSSEPLASPTSVFSAPYETDPSMFTIGPTFEAGMPRGLAFEVSALHKGLKYRREFLAISPSQGFREERNLNTTAHSWEVPVVLKKYIKTGSPVRAYGDVGFAARRFTGTTHIDGFRSESPGGLGFPRVTTTLSGEENPSELVSNWSGGLVLGGGFDLSLGALHVLPELRYTRWANKTFRSSDGTLESSRNTVDFLVGITLRK